MRSRSLRPSDMVVGIGNGTAFAKGRDFAAWLGLVPKQMSTRNRTILGSSRHLPQSLENKKVQGFGNIDSRMPVSLLEAAWEFAQFAQSRLQPAAKAIVRRSIGTTFPMTTLTVRDLEALIGLRTSWKELYSKELARLLNEDDTPARPTRRPERVSHVPID